MFALTSFLFQGRAVNQIRGNTFIILGTRVTRGYVLCDQVETGAEKNGTDRQSRAEHCFCQKFLPPPVLVLARCSFALSFVFLLHAWLFFISLSRPS